ncbi:MAG: hypothetical protein ABJD07_03965 [Gemmatimonadaceae bacterium]
MAHDQTPTPPPIDAGTIAAVRSALLAYARDPTHTEQLRSTLGDLATEARAKSVRPEKLLVLLKEMWGSIAEVRQARDGAPFEHMLRQLITMCIDVYYGDR